MRSLGLRRFAAATASLGVAAFGALLFSPSLSAQESQTLPPFQALDIFEIEWALNPQISPDSQQVVYRRMGFDIMEDRRRGNLWLVDIASQRQHKLSSFEGNESSAVWSPRGDRIAYVRSAGDDEGAEIYMHWLEGGQSARVTRLPATPKDIRWSPDGRHLAFVMDVKAEAPSLASRPEKPEGAQWSDMPRVTDRMYHERDGSGYLDAAFSHVFVVPAEGGTARQITRGDFHHRQPSWSADGESLLVSGNRSEDWQYDYRNSEIYRVALRDGDTAAVTSTDGPDHHPLVSPDGKHLAWLGYADKKQAFQVTRLRIARHDGSGMRELLGDLDRSVKAITWSADSDGLYFQYDDKGRTKVAYVSLKDSMKTLADNLGGTSIGRPYAGGSFSVSGDGVVAYTHTRPEYPADIAIHEGSKTRVITRLNDDLLSQRTLGETREIWWKSSFDERDIQGWMVLPPDFDPNRQYPLLVENHGGPILNYGERFSPEMQLFAAAGYVVFYPNARGSTSYGEEFANLLYHNYPGQDYDDTMSGVDAMIELGFIDPEQLYVTGGSAGGIMTAWIIGKTDRFRAAAAIKPVMNWYSKTLNADNWYNYYFTRIPGTPWTNPDDYLRFSPISLVGEVNTPTLVMVGLDDLRTPPSQAKQLYHALKYRKVPTLLVELPGASHFIARKPSQLIDKVSHILAWFERYQ
ncbi:S9 family peptidase [Congregibacter litoralis]|uniref:Dipeptidyl aminopeptidases/acylaminoacyl-peptidase n=1 Tax=Congregibacter litoralis KT71 TaxID=314285 RepID=A4A430_9GAMM|nr:S9 family peptidase [Congregibacter litoralis]EAQ99453.1 Dipeptidyl aminopeptidases/acylaminoacyl-peptidase [Congregibacter litoralis KT71]